jgi:hypothetical protein
MLAYKSMKSRENREKTAPFEKKSWTRAGLFFVGNKVCCFCCGYCTRSWTAAKDPWIFHFPTCDFARFNCVNGLPSSKTESLVGEPSCIVCLENKISTVSLPCMHAVSCAPCASACLSCPVCRSKVVERLEIFLP